VPSESLRERGFRRVVAVAPRCDGVLGVILGSHPPRIPWAYRGRVPLPVVMCLRDTGSVR
jgi:hypothetical protein